MEEILLNTQGYLLQTLGQTNLSSAVAQSLTTGVLLMSFLFLMGVLHFGIRSVIRFLLDRKTGQVNFWSYLRKNRFAHSMAQIIPVKILSEGISIIFSPFPSFILPLQKLIEAYSVFVTIWIVQALASSVMDTLKEKPAFKEKPMESWSQVIYISLVCVGIFYIYNIFTNKPIGELLAYLGAASAVLLLIFKDTILGFVASITVTTNDMVRIGDWITMPESNADGDVIEINLNTVKVQNFDKTITTIPTYKLISNSFQNWRGMKNAGGRRIKRSINIIQSTVRFVEEPDLDRLAQIQEIANYITERRKQIDDYNYEKRADKRVLINGRNMTNLGLFRKYADYYLKNHPNINKNLTAMVRQLAATSKGIPVEIYAFTDTTDWVAYETIQSDIFDHLIASVPFFDLEIFEDLHNTSVQSVPFSYSKQEPYNL